MVSASLLLTWPHVELCEKYSVCVSVRLRHAVLLYARSCAYAHRYGYAYLRSCICIYIVVAYDVARDFDLEKATKMAEMVLTWYIYSIYCLRNQR